MDLFGVYDMTKQQCESLVNGFLKSMEAGLAKDDQELKMLPSYVSKFDPSHGTFYALDLGGTNFRVLRVQLNQSEPDVIKIKNFVIDPKHMQGTGDDLFDFLAACIQEAIEAFGDEAASLQQPVRLGFTFSFPCRQTSLSAGTLVRWTKGFVASGVEGREVVAMLQAALQRLDVHAHVDALVNDTVGTLMALRRSQPNVAVGVILGTGTNGCYIEDLSRVAKWSPPIAAAAVLTPPPTPRRMCINMEWGNFGQAAESRALLPITEADAQLDRESLNPGEQIFEKLVGGM